MPTIQHKNNKNKKRGSREDNLFFELRVKGYDKVLSFHVYSSTSVIMGAVAILRRMLQHDRGHSGV